MCGEHGEVTGIIDLVIKILAGGTLFWNSYDTLSWGFASNCFTGHGMTFLLARFTHWTPVKLIFLRLGPRVRWQVRKCWVWRLPLANPGTTPWVGLSHLLQTTTRTSEFWYLNGRQHKSCPCFVFKSENLIPKLVGQHFNYQTMYRDLNFLSAGRKVLVGPAGRQSENVGRKRRIVMVMVMIPFSTEVHKWQGWVALLFGHLHFLNQNHYNWEQLIQLLQLTQLTQPQPYFSRMKSDLLSLERWRLWLKPNCCIMCPSVHDTVH